MNIHSADNRQITLTRLINAPRELLFQVFTDADHHANWHCPDGFTITTHNADIRVGGTLRYTMHGPDGTDYVNRHTYHEITPHSRITYTHGGEDDDAEHDFEVTITFDEKDGKTLVTNNLLLKTVDQYNFSIGFGAVELGNQTMAKLDAYATKLNAKETR